VTEPPRASGRAGAVVEAIVLPAAAIAVSLVLFGLFVAVAGANPFAMYHQMVRGAFGTWFSLQNSLQRAAPLMLTALCTAIPARLGLVVIGGEGALVLGGLAAAAVAAALASSGALTVEAAMIVAAVVAGALWIGLCTGLRAIRGVNETISSLLLNYIAIGLFNHLVEGPLRDPASLNKPSTAPIGEAHMLGQLPGMDVHWGLGFGVIACVVAWVLVDRTTYGFAARMVGGNPRAAKLAGVPVRRLVVAAGALGGGCAGLAGMAEVAAVHGTANASLIAGYGYNGILVAFLARHHPLAIMPVALLVGGVAASSGLLQRSVGLPDAAVNVLQGILFVVILASETLRGRFTGRSWRWLRVPRAAAAKEVA
jgi:ABC-type uncharacterized transport system permease subunit